MMVKPATVCSIAIQIEENGERLYRGLSEAFTLDPPLYELFQRLADEELEHASDFRKLLGGDSDCATADGGYSILDAYARVFSRSRLGDEIAGLGRSVESSLDFAIRREMDSIFFYHEAGAGRPGALGATLSRIVEEERRHFRELNDLRNRITGS